MAFSISISAACIGSSKLEVPTAFSPTPIRHAPVLLFSYETLTVKHSKQIQFLVLVHECS